MSIPENDYHFNTIDCTTKNSQIYKLGDIPNSINNGLISSKTHNMTIDFATSIEGQMKKKKMKIISELLDKKIITVKIQSLFLKISKMYIYQ